MIMTRKLVEALRIKLVFFIVLVVKSMSWYHNFN